jgi:beta-lactamase class A
LSVWNPALHVENPNENAPSIRQSAIGSSTATEGSAPIPREIALSLGQELTDLKAQLEGIEAQVPGLTLSTFLYDLETQEYLNLNGGAPVSAASVIKVPILVAFLQAVDQGEVRLDEPLAIAADQIASGSGDMQMEPPGTIYTALETASWMIINSDNTATNMLIDRLGGAEKLNELFRSWGLEDTVIRNPLPDLDGTNTTSPEDLVSLLTLIDRGELLSLRSRDRMFAIMQRTYTDSLLPRGLGEGAIISHKTGDIGSLLGDAGIVDLPNGKRYVLAVLVQRPHNDGRAHELIHLVSQLAYSELSTPLQPDPINSPAEAEVQSPPAE